MLYHAHSKLSFQDTVYPLLVQLEEALYSFTMNKHVVLALLLCLATVQARLFHDDALASAGRSLMADACPAGCASNACVPDSTNTGFVCTQCVAGVNLNSVDGTCECPPGRYTNGNTCTDCPKGSFCKGGIFGGTDAVATDCNDGAIAGSGSALNGLTTRGLRSRTVGACVNAPGHSFSLDGSSKPTATVCPVDTYSPGLKKQQGCVSCPSGFKTLDLTKQTSILACKVPAGFYLRGPGEVAPCPMGEYQATNTTVGKCTKCSAGVTTAAEQSISKAACNQLLPSYYASGIDVTDNEITATKKCPQKYYCPGGPATAVFVTSPLGSTTNTGANLCLNELWTEKFGAISPNECLTPPGYYTSGTATTICPTGSYRADWKNPADADKCDSCGSNIQSEQIDRITLYDITDYSETTANVAMGPGACYIEAGQGMYYNPTTKNFTVVNCNSDNYGVAAKTYGLGGFACRQCPTNMKTDPTLSAAYYVTNGYTNPLACVTKVGYGYNGRIATQCPIDSYNDEGNRHTCTKCDYGLRTTGVDTAQKDTNDCGIAEGFGYHNSMVQPCPIGYYNDARQTTKTAACTACSTIGAGLTTSQPGGRSTTDCNLCVAGYGGNNCTTSCGGGLDNLATYGPAGRPSGEACITCPTMAADMGFTFNYGGVSNNFNPLPAARSGAESSADCLSSYAQLAQGNWFMGPTATLTNDTAASFTLCVSACGTSCLFATFDYAATAGSGCKLANYVQAAGKLTAVKALQAGDITAASLKKAVNSPAAVKAVTGKALSSGSYTFWNMDASTLAAGSASAASGTTVEKCLLACDQDSACAAVVMTGMSAATDAPGTCTKLYGDTAAGSSLRSVTRVNIDRLNLASGIF